MRPLRRQIFTAVAVLGLVAAGLAPASPAAAKPTQTSFLVIQVGDDIDSIAINYEYRWRCLDVLPTPCETFAGTVYIKFRVVDRPTPATPITLDYAIDDITAVHGVNYSGPTSGTVTIPADWPGQVDTFLSIPILDTGSEGAPDKTLRVRLTGSSVPGADLSATEIATIRSGGFIPRDCTPSRPDAFSFSTTCTDRPAGFQWRTSVTALVGEWPMYQTFLGPVVTGNGTSTASSASSGKTAAWWDYRPLS